MAKNRRDFMSQSRFSEFGDCFDLVVRWFDAVSVDTMSEECDVGFGDLALGKINFDVVLV